jgi:hypothetical protein
MRSVYALPIGVVHLLGLQGGRVVRGVAPPTPLRVPYGICPGDPPLREVHFVNTLISFLAMNADILLIGKVLHMENLGYYTLGKEHRHPHLARVLPDLRAVLPARREFGEP